MVGRATFADKTQVNERSRLPDASQVAWDPQVPPGVAVVAFATPQSGCFLVNGFFTIGPQNRDLAALLPGNDSYGRPASFSFSWER